MPFEALLASDSEIVPVGAIEHDQREVGVAAAAVAGLDAQHHPAAVVEGLDVGGLRRLLVGEVAHGVVGRGLRAGVGLDRWGGGDELEHGGVERVVASRCAIGGSTSCFPDGPRC